MHTPPPIRTVLITGMVHDDTRNLLASRFDLICNDRPEPWTRQEISTRLRSADAMLAFMTDTIDAELLDAAPNLRIVAGALKGFDNFDVEACTRCGVWLAIVPNHLTAPSAELAVGLAIGLVRKVAAGDRLIRTGHFSGWRPILYGGTLTGATIGIAGMGLVGRAIAQRLSGFDATILYTDATPLTVTEERRLGCTFAPLDAMVSRSDIVMLALPLTPTTHHLIDTSRLATFKRGACLVNIARGSLVCERDVAEALRAGTLGGYAADVFELEDWAIPDRPREIDPALLSLTDLTLFTPHLGSAVADVRRAIELEAALNIIEFADGRTPRGAINRPATREFAMVEPC